MSEYPISLFSSSQSVSTPTSLTSDPCLRLESVEPELLAVMGVMPSLEQNLTKSLRELARGKEREKQGSSDRHRQAAAQLSRLQAQQEELQ